MLRDAPNSADDSVNGVANVPECPQVPMDRGSDGVTWENADKESSAHASEYRLAGTSFVRLCRNASSLDDTAPAS